MLFLRKYIFLVCMYLVLSNCTSLQQMHTAETLEQDKSESVYGLSVTKPNESDSDFIVAAQLNSRRGLSENVDFGHYLNLSLVNVGGGAYVFPGIGLDVKRQVVDAQKINVALDMGIDLGFISTLNFGVIVNNDFMYGSLFYHKHASFESFDFNDSSNSNLSMTMGHKNEKYIYEFRLPLYGYNGELALGSPVFSIGMIK